jgi:hypothetical protein
MEATVVVRDAQDQWHATVAQPGIPEGHTVSPAYPSRALALTALVIRRRTGTWPEWDAAAGTWRELGGVSIKTALADLDVLLNDAERAGQ